MAKFKILSLSGGGIRGLYQASFLSRLEELAGKQILGHFDLIVGTSTGGLIALAIALGQSVSSIRDFYLDNAALLFPPPKHKGILGIRKRYYYPQHDDVALCKAIQLRLGTETRLGDAKCWLVINSFLAPSGKPKCFKTRHHPDFVSDYKMKAWEVAMATSAAPIFYRAFQSESGAEYIDGGVWANCPVVVGAIEAIDRFGKDRNNVDILSVGTTRCPFHISADARNGGMAQYIKNKHIVNLLFEANRASAMYMAARLVGPSNVFEVDHVIDSGGYEMDDSRDSTLKDLKALGEQDAQTHVKDIKERFLAERVPTPVPIAIE